MKKTAIGNNAKTTELFLAINQLLGVNNILNDWSLNWFNDQENISSFYDKVLIAAKVGEDSGGDCWGGTASHYTVDDTDIQSEVTSVLCDKIEELMPFDSLKNNWKELISELINASVQRCNGITSDRISEYYGNGYDYELYQLDLNEVADCIFDTKNAVVSESLILAKNHSAQLYKVQQITNSIARTKNMLENFDKDSVSSLQTIQKRITYEESGIKAATLRLANLKKDLENHAQNRACEQARLKKLLEEEQALLNKLKNDN